MNDLKRIIQRGKPIADGRIPAIRAPLVGRALRISPIGVSTGGLGSITRRVGGPFGTAVAFAVGKAAPAPGQAAIGDLRVVLGVVDRAAAANR